MGCDVVPRFVEAQAPPRPFLSSCSLDTEKLGTVTEGPPSSPPPPATLSAPEPTVSRSILRRTATAIAAGVGRPQLCKLQRMGSGEDKPVSHLEEEIFHKFRDFMTGITKIDELGNAGSRLLSGFQQALEFIRRPHIDTNSTLISKIIEANGTNRVKSYINSGCRNPNDSVQNVTNLYSCKRGLLNHISKAKVILTELEGILGDVTSAVQSTHGNLMASSDQDFRVELNEQATYNDSDENAALSHSQITDATTTEEKKNADFTHLASLMAIIYGMAKQDYLMQEKIVSALDLKVPSEELQSFCEMWSWRPFIDDDIMHQAWELIP